MNPLFSLFNVLPNNPYRNYDLDTATVHLYQMPASSSPSMHEDAPTSRDDDQHSSYNPPISKRRLPKLTPARLAFFAATLGLGIPKAVASAEGQETVANILDLNLGVVWPCVYVIKPTFRILLTVNSYHSAYCLSIFENECPQVAPWFLEYDLFQVDPIILEVITMVTVTFAVIVSRTYRSTNFCTTPSQHILSTVYAFVPFLSNPSLFSNPKLRPALPIIHMGVGLTALVAYLVLKKITRKYRTLLLILPQTVRLIYRKVQHVAYNTVNRCYHHFAVFHKVCMAGVLFFARMFFPCQFNKRISLITPRQYSKGHSIIYRCTEDHNGSFKWLIY